MVARGIAREVCCGSSQRQQYDTFPIRVPLRGFCKLLFGVLSMCLSCNADWILVHPSAAPGGGL